MTIDESFADRAWLAFQALPRNQHGDLPAETEIEATHELSRGLLGKIFSGKQKSVRNETLTRLAVALGTTPEFLVEGRGARPRPQWPLKPREVRYENRERVPVKVIAATAEVVPVPALPASEESDVLRAAKKRAALALVREHGFDDLDYARELVEASVALEHRLGHATVAPDPRAIAALAVDVHRARGRLRETASAEEIAALGLDKASGPPPSTDPHGSRYPKRRRAGK